MTGAARNRIDHLKLIVRTAQQKYHNSESAG